MGDLGEGEEKGIGRNAEGSMGEGQRDACGSADGGGEIFDKDVPCAKQVVDQNKLQGKKFGPVAT